MNNYVNPDLPTIFLHEINSYFLIDTGSGKSFIKPELAYEMYPHSISNEPFAVWSAHAKSIHNKFAEIPIFPSFNSPENHKF